MESVKKKRRLRKSKFRLKESPWGDSSEIVHVGTDGGKDEIGNRRNCAGKIGVCTFKV